MEDLQSKHPYIQFLWSKIEEEFGAKYFTLVDFWEADLLATGFRHGVKLVYVSIWDEETKEAHPGQIYCMGELIDEETLDTLKIGFEKKRLDLDELLKTIFEFLNE